MNIDKEKCTGCKACHALFLVLVAAGWHSGALAQQVPLLGSTIPKYVDPLPDLDLISGTSLYTLSACEFKANVLPSPFVPATGSYTGTWVWGCEQGDACPSTTQPTYIGPVVVANRGSQTTATYRNRLGATGTSNLLSYVVD